MNLTERRKIELNSSHHKEKSRGEQPVAVTPLMINDGGLYSRVVRDSLGIRCPLDLFTWLQGELQYFLPHEVMIASWGDFAAGQIRYDVISLPDIPAEPASASGISVALSRLHQRWIAYHRLPFEINNQDAVEMCATIDELPRTLFDMRSALVHGVRDERGQQDCLYVIMNSGHAITADARKNLEILLPYIDTALRRIPQPVHRHYKKADQLAAPPVCIGTLSSRESEILDWVRKGKTNQEIGLILGISAYTVKNHLQRIFRKLDVYNRAQAVGKLAEAGNLQDQNYSHG